MRLLRTLERKLGRYAIPHVTETLIAAQAAVFFMTLSQVRGEVEPAFDVLGRIQLVPALVWQGEVWRLLTFLAVPPVSNPLFAFFFWYLFYLMGTALEGYWGVFRYNLYLLIGLVATVAVSFLIPNQPATNAFLQGSIFLAFAYLNPDFELYIFFVLPVKIKWLAAITWIGYAFAVITGDWLTRLLVLASASNFLLFFGQDIRQGIETGRRRMAYQAGQFARSDEPFHRCTVCGITDQSHSDMDFRYCTKCEGTCGYCTEHLHNHTHITAETAQM